MSDGAIGSFLKSTIHSTHHGEIQRKTGYGVYERSIFFSSSFEKCWRQINDSHLDFCQGDERFAMKRWMKIKRKQIKAFGTNIIMCN